MKLASSDTPKTGFVATRPNNKCQNRVCWPEYLPEVLSGNGATFNC